MSYTYYPLYFKLHELVPQVVYETVPHHKIWYCWDPHVLWTADRLRERYGKINVNTWFWGGHIHYRGWRPQTPPPEQRWAPWTMHAWFRALDMVFIETSAEEVRGDIVTNKYPVDFQHITCIEADVPWLHFDTRNFNNDDGPLVVSP